MKQKHFYSHLIETSDISLALGDLTLSVSERKELIHLADINIHKTIIDLVLSELSQEDKKQFLLHLHRDHHERIWTLLRGKIDNIENKIQEVANDIKKQLYDDVKKLQE